jgi:pimeloyl-ACP methyl ester carboxylesterase
MEQVRSRDGTSIAFERIGTGPPLILVGGALSDRTAARGLATALSERLTAVAYDRRGRGDSGDTPPYAVEREIEDLEALIGAVGGRASVFGHSSGGMLSLEAAAAGIAIERLAVYEPPFIVDQTREPMPEDVAARLGDLVEAGRRGDAVAAFMTDGVGLAPEMVEGMRGAPMWPDLEALAHTLVYDMAVMGDTMRGRPLPADRWGSLTMPTLVLDGGVSPEWQRSAARALAEVLPNATARTLEGQGHGAPEDVLAPVLLGFFA